MTKEQIVALLGRPLTSVEDANFNLYLDIAEETLEELICTPISDISETRVFDVREGYSTAFIDIFWQITEVKIDGNVVSDYSERQWNKRNASWYNSLVFDNRFCAHKKEIEVTADWGFEPSSDSTSYPADLQLLIAGLFGQITKKNKFNPTVASKQNREYRISFNSNVDLDAEFYKTYGTTISKYSLCDIPNIQHGEVSCGCR